LTVALLLIFSKTSRAQKQFGAFVAPIVSLLADNDCFISFITKLETLGYPDMPLMEEINIRAFLSKVTILPTNDAIEEEAIRIRRGTNLKLPDAIIAATAVVIGAEIVTTDNDFLKCQYPVLRVQ
jgi:predicted nucleic acid-binding protein